MAYHPNLKGGRRTKGGVSPEAQLVIPIKALQATVLVNPSKVQVYWSGDYADIHKIEQILNNVVVSLPNQPKFGEESRIDVQTIRMYQQKVESLTEKLDYHEWKETVDSALRRAAKIRDGQISGSLRVNRRAYIDRAHLTLIEIHSLVEKARGKGWNYNEPFLRTEAARLREILNFERRHSIQRWRNRSVSRFPQSRNVKHCQR